MVINSEHTFEFDCSYTSNSITSQSFLLKKLFCHVIHFVSNATPISDINIFMVELKIIAVNGLGIYKVEIKENK